MSSEKLPRSVVSILSGVVALCVCLPIEFIILLSVVLQFDIAPALYLVFTISMIGIVLIFYGFLGLEFVKGGPFIGAMILIAWGSAAIIESYIQFQVCTSLPLVSCPAYNPGLFLLIVAGGFILIGIYVYRLRGGH